MSNSKFKLIAFKLSSLDRGQSTPERQLATEADMWGDTSYSTPLQYEALHHRNTMDATVYT